MEKNFLILNEPKRQENQIKTKKSVVQLLRSYDDGDGQTRFFFHF